VLTSQSTRWHDRPCLHEGFTDIPPLAFYAGSVKWLADEGITSGFTDDLFGPDKLVTRGQFAAFLWRYSGEPQTSPNDDFADVAADASYAQAVAWMVESEIATGRAPDRFDPSSNVNRAQSVVFLHRLAGEPRGEAQIDFDDVEEGAWYRDALMWAIEKDIVWWTDLDAFGAGLPASRADVAVLIHRYHLREPEPEEPEESEEPEPSGSATLGAAP
jgi:hypothetical protein